VTRKIVSPGRLAALVEDPDGLIALARDLVAAASQNPPGDERAVADVLVRALRDLGIADVRVVGPTPVRRNVIARIPGRGGGRSLILNGHIDTKPPGDLDAWETPPWEPVVRDGRLYGLGAADMKGAVAAMVFAAAEVARAELAGDLVLVFSADEEEGSACGARWLAEQGMIAADAAIIGEPSGLAHDWEAIRLVSRGVFLFRVDVEGTSMHSSLSDHLESVNANVEMGRLLARFAEHGSSILHHRPHPLAPAGPTLNVALVARGGSGQGVVPGSASFVSDVRALPGMDRDGILGDVEAFLANAAEVQPGLKASVEVEAWLPPCEIDPAHPVVQALAEASAEVLGRTPPFAVFPGGTDAPHFQLTGGVPTVPSYGPGVLTAAHRPNESITLRSIVEAAGIYSSAAKRFLGA
jgi:acetylornithine deacetylase/succinyl-diaminopimelate desuccinylase family protein